MKMIKISFLLFLSGCSIYPLPQDVTDYSSRDVALQIRCGAKFSVEKELESVLDHFGNTPAYETYSASQFSDLLDKHPDSYSSLNWQNFKGPIKSLFDFYKDTGVSYDFTLDGTEQNDFNLGGGVNGAWSHRTDTLGFKVANERTREAKRHFRLYDSFDSLIHTPEVTCRDFNHGDPDSKLPNKSFAQTPHYMFPSTGMLRIRDLIHDFVVQNQTNNLGGPDKSWSTADMTDTITFTTKSTGNFDPSTKMVTAVHGWSLASLNLGSDNSRQDVHTIVIDVSLPADKSGLPTFDSSGRLVSAPARPNRVAQADANLDKAQSKNAQDALQIFATFVVRQNQ